MTRTIHRSEQSARILRYSAGDHRIRTLAYVKTRKVRNKRLADACHRWAFATLTKSAGAREHYDKRRAAGDHHNAALRNLANKLLGRLWWCLANNHPWDDNAAWPHRNQHANLVAA